MSINEPHGVPAPDERTGASAPVSPARDMIAATLALAVGAVALWGTGGMSTLGSVFPTTAAGVLIAAALALAARSLLRGPTPPPEARMPPRAEWWRLVGVMIVLLAWALLLRPLGFLATSALGLLALGPLVVREPMTLRAVLLHIAAGAILLLGFWLLMAHVLRIAVPVGTMFS